ncbi:MAG: TolB family protein [Actinomycetota bacterium]
MSRRCAARKTLIALTAALSLLASLAAPAGAYKRPGATERVNVSSRGEQAKTGVLPNNSISRGRSEDCYFVQFEYPDMTPDGRYVVFSSPADNLVTGDTNLTCDVFRHDRRTGETIRVSVDSAGREAAVPILPDNTLVSCSTGPPASFEPAISRNGRYVAFTSIASNLVPGDTNLACDVFVHDVKLGHTERVSVHSDGSQAELDLTRPQFPPNSSDPSISASGRYVVFESVAPDLADEDKNGGNTDIFLHDRKTRTTTIVSLTEDGGPTNAGSLNAFINAGGRFVVYDSTATNILRDGNRPGVFLHDIRTKTTELISFNSTGSQSGLWNSHVNTGSGRVISDNGRFVLFHSPDPEYVPNDTNQALGIPAPDVFVRDRKTGRTERVSVRSDGQEADSHSGERMSLSPDGRHVFFTSRATNLFPGDTAPALQEAAGQSDNDAYIYDRETGALEWISVSPEGSEGDNQCGSESGAGIGPMTISGAIGANGRYVALLSCSTNLVEGDTNDEYDVFVRDRGEPLGIGGFDGDEPDPSSDPDEFCIGDTCIPVTCIESVCIPPGSFVSSSDRSGEDGLLQGSDLIEARMAHRPQFGDLFVAIEIGHMPAVFPGASPIFYGLRFEVENRNYEVRATSLAYGTFGLFDCTDSPTCAKVADLRGGYGTTGMRVVFSLPLEAIGLKDGGKLKDVAAFSGIGNYLTGATKVLDRVNLK